MRILTLLILFVPAFALAQERPPQLLEPVEVTVTRDAARSTLDLPFAISVVQPDSARPEQRRLSLDEALVAIPGVSVANRFNPTQDPRISIRGFGARSAFGVRGIRVLRDGIPLTMPDGQTPVDYLDLESAGTIEIIRGSAGALYGNAAGGVIDIRTDAAPDVALAGRARLLHGSHGLLRGHAMAGGTGAGIGWQAHMTHTRSDGYRDYSAQRATTALIHGAHDRGADRLAVQLMLFDMPRAENPGALTLAELSERRTNADPLAVSRQARKAVRQGQLGASISRPLAATGEVTVAAHGAMRQLDNPLPFAIVDIDRRSWGVSARVAAPVTMLGVRQRATAGLDAQWQFDDRTNFENCNRPPEALPPALCPVPGVERGRLRLDQQERITSIGPYVRTEIEITQRLLASLGGRADLVRFDVGDRLITETDPDDSGTRTLSALSPMAGLVARAGDRTAIYVTYSTAFETPTATELANQPDGSAGLNRDLDPQRAATWELGVKGDLPGGIRYDAALYSTAVRDELIPFEIPDGAGRRYFRNAGRTSRRGVEGGLGAGSGPFIVQLSYTLASFRFAEFTVSDVRFDGNVIPGVPHQQLQGAVTWSEGTFFATAEAIATSSVQANDANTVRVPGYEVLNLRVGGRGMFGRPWLSPVLGVHNVFDRTYVPSVSVNATGGRFYEPAPGRAVYVALTAGLGR
jgi:iron complex outermembrane recepter protein